MKKKIFTVLAAGIFAISATLSANCAQQIPYPAGLDTQSEGASSAPNTINHAQSNYFNHADFYNLTQPTQNIVLLKHYPTYQQTRENTCGPAAGLTVLYYYGNCDFDEMTLAEKMQTKPYPIGTSVEGVANFFKSIGWQVESSMTNSPFEEYQDFADWVLENLGAGKPIIVENVDWGGHWRVIIGYDDLNTETTLDDVLILADSYDTCDHNQDGYVVENGEKFFAMWFDHSMLPENQRNQPWVIACPK